MSCMYSISDTKVDFEFDIFKNILILKTVDHYLLHCVTCWPFRKHLNKKAGYMVLQSRGHGLKCTCILGKTLTMETMTQNMRLRLMKTLCSVQLSGVV